MGPSAIRYAGLDARIARARATSCVDLGNVGTAVAEATRVGDEHARFLPQIKETCEAHRRARRERGAGRVRAARARRRPLRRARHARRASRDVHGPGGVIWIDAHGDLNSPETSPSGNVHGMVLAAALGLGRRAVRRATAGAAGASRRAGWRSSGVRSLDEGERELLERARCARLHDERRRSARRGARGPGGAGACRRRRASCTSASTWTPLDPDVAPGVGTPVRGGLSYREAHLALELVAESGLATLARRRRGQSDPRPRERDREACGRARRLALGARIL